MPALSCLCWIAVSVYFGSAIWWALFFSPNLTDLHHKPDMSTREPSVNPIEAEKVLKQTRAGCGLCEREREREREREMDTCFTGRVASRTKSSNYLSLSLSHTHTHTHTSTHNSLSVSLCLSHTHRPHPARVCFNTFSASIGLNDGSRVDMSGLWCKSVEFGAGRSAHQIGEPK